ncbi:MAG: imidazolonepropionase [Planctomycetota bacterium]
MGSLVLEGGRILTLNVGDLPRRGHAMRELGIIEQGSVHCVDGEIVAVSDGSIDVSGPHERVDVQGRIIMPAFVDCHTHACWAGDRFDEFEMALAGTAYLDILKAGGGIMSTVRAVRDASEDDLVALLGWRLRKMMNLGTGTVEVKSGYGLTTADELKMLRAVHRAQGQSPLSLTGTFLGAHAIDRDDDNFIERTIKETLPAVAEEFPGITCDAYCEEGSWSFNDTRRLFESAMALGCSIRIHTDQFNSMGMTGWSVDAGALSVDHLEAVTEKDLAKLAASDTIGVALPASGFQLDDRYAPGRALIDQDGILAIASNYNPGSAPSPSVPFTIALACRKMHLTPAEAITASTVNAACVLRRESHVGRIAAGMRADLQVLDILDERELAYEFATAGPALVVLNGRIVQSRLVDPTDDAEAE